MSDEYYRDRNGNVIRVNSSRTEGVAQDGSRFRITESSLRGWTRVQANDPRAVAQELANARNGPRRRETDRQTSVASGQDRDERNDRTLMSQRNQQYQTVANDRQSVQRQPEVVAGTGIDRAYSLSERGQRIDSARIRQRGGEASTGRSQQPVAPARQGPASSQQERQAREGQQASSIDSMLALNLQRATIGREPQSDASADAARPSPTFQILKAPREDYEPLDPGYERRSSRWFSAGRVFTAWWPEPAGDTKRAESLFSAGYTQEGRFGQWIFGKFRWFVVLRSGPDFSVCLPIATYRRNGVAKKGTAKEYHAVIYTGSVPEVKEGERGLLPPVRVNPDSRDSKLDPMSRLHYGKPYTVEHKVKAKPFGQVNQLYLNAVERDYAYVQASMTSGARPRQKSGQASASTSIVASSSKAPQRRGAENEASSDSEESESASESSEDER